MAAGWRQAWMDRRVYGFLRESGAMDMAGAWVGNFG